MIKIIVYLCLVLLISACTASSESVPNNSGEIVAEEASEIVAPNPLEEATVEDSPVGRGSVLFNESRGGFACATCHYSSESRLLGPGLADTAVRFETYEIEGTVEDYLYTSIIDPTAFIAPADPAYPENIMPTSYGELFSEEEIQDIIAYILSL